MTQFIDLFPDQKKKKGLAKLIQIEGFKLAKQELNASRHTVDTASRTLVSTVVLKRQSWLRTSALPLNTWSRIEDLLFEGKLHSQQPNKWRDREGPENRSHSKKFEFRVSAATHLQ